MMIEREFTTIDTGRRKKTWRLAVQQRLRQVLLRKARGTLENSRPDWGVRIWQLLLRNCLVQHGYQKGLAIQILDEFFGDLYIWRGIGLVKSPALLYEQ